MVRTSYAWMTTRQQYNANGVSSIHQGLGCRNASMGFSLASLNDSSGTR
ncbi:hypothetical protein [Caballeronia choica]|nr:hypothetical protein [Caballeronia choica]